MPGRNSTDGTSIHKVHSVGAQELDQQHQQQQKLSPANSRFDRSVHDDKPRFRYGYDDDVASSQTQDNARRRRSIYDSLGVLRTSSNESSVNSNDERETKSLKSVRSSRYQQPELQKTQKVETKTKGGPNFLKKTLSTLSLSSAAAPDDESASSHAPRKSHHTHGEPLQSKRSAAATGLLHSGESVPPPRKTSFASNLFKRLSGSSPHSNKLGRPSKSKITPTTSNQVPMHTPLEEAEADNPDYIGPQNPNTSATKVPRRGSKDSIFPLVENVPHHIRSKIGDIQEDMNGLIAEVPRLKRNHTSASGASLSSTNINSSSKVPSVGSQLNSVDSGSNPSMSSGKMQTSRRHSAVSKERDPYTLKFKEPGELPSEKQRSVSDGNIGPEVVEGQNNKRPSVVLTESGLFPLDTNLDDLTDITKTVEAREDKIPDIHTKKREPSLEGMPEDPHVWEDNPLEPIRSASALNFRAVESEEAKKIFPPNIIDPQSTHWVAPESWDVDIAVKQKKKARAKSKRKHERATAATGGSVSSKSVNRIKNGLVMTPSRQNEEGNEDADDSDLIDNIEYSSGEDTSSSLTSTSSSNSASCASSDGEFDNGPCSGDKKLDEDKVGKFDISGRTFSSVNLASVDKSPSAVNVLNLDDERSDKVEYELERYYKDYSDLDIKKHYAIRVFNVDDTFTTLMCTPGTTVEEMIPTLKKKFNITSKSSYQISLRVGKLAKILKPTSKPIFIERKLLLLNGYRKSDPLHIIGIEDLSFVFKFLFHPVTPSHFTAEQELRLLRSDFVHVDLRNMDLTTPPIIFYQHTSEIESLDVSNNANIFLPLEFIESTIKLMSLRMVNVRASKFPVNVTEAYKLVSLELQRNFIKKVPKTISKLGNLTILNLQCNELDRLPKGFAQLKNLQLLDLSSNKFVEYPEVINNCVNLLQVDLSYNKIYKIPASINKLVKLVKMNLSHNKLNELEDISGMKNLRTLTLPHNRITQVKTMSESLQNLYLTDNRISNFEDKLPKLRSLDLQENPITSISVKDCYPTNMTSLSLRKAQLASIPGELFTELSSLEKLELNDNNLSRLPKEISLLSRLVYLSVSRNKLECLPPELSKLKSLRTLDLHSNNIRDFFEGMEEIELTSLNISSNVLGTTTMEGSFFDNMLAGSKLSKSLFFLSAADNQFGDDMWPLFNSFSKLQKLNLSYNNMTDISQMHLTDLTELYFSGNKLSTLPGEVVSKWKQLKTLMLNGNQLLTLPSELSLLTQLTAFDVGSNKLKYNISNYLFDWNWRNNKELKYLNFSGNRKFEIRGSLVHELNADLSDLTVLPHLKELGLMDVTLNTTKVPDESSNFRLRTTVSTINGMRYGVADTLGQRDHVSSRDVTFDKFRGNDDECLLCLHDSKNQTSDYGHNISGIVRDIYDKILIRQLEKYGDQKDEDVKKALRFSFLQLNKEINNMLSSVDSGANIENLTAADLLSGACSTVIFIKGNKLYASNLGDCMAVLSKNNGDYQKLTKQHLPTKREEYERIRISGGYVNNGKLDGVADVSRAVGFFDLLPHIHASPDTSVITLSKTDEMLIIATHTLWDYTDIETACDIARENRLEPMLAAEAMKDHAIAYGCQENITILCLALDKSTEGSLNKNSLMTRRSTFEDAALRRLQPEISPPTGNVAVVFTDIKNSTVLWELFPNAMRTAIKTHNDLMRRQLRIYGGYEVKTEGDAFMVTFPTPTGALAWCLSVQSKLLDCQWPEEITSIQDGCTVTDNEGRVIYQGLSVRMGIHWGYPVTELDLVTQRMDYLGPVVNKAARVSSVADGGQITLSSDFMSEFNKIMKCHEAVVKDGMPLREVYREQIIGEVLEREIAMLEGSGWEFFVLGEKKLKGLETKEFITIVYPQALASRHEFASEDDQSKAIDEELLFRLRTTSNRLECILSVVSGGSLELEHAKSGITFNTLDSNSRTSIMGSASEKDVMLFLDHLVTRIESSVALLQLRQKVTTGLHLYNNIRGKKQLSVFELIDKLLEEVPGNDLTI
ncbi:adenylate cyclase KNAG_0M01710 [Huiozyma naganishii CBS 8797]|uniref:Adenylate cyclase n=1 Tax=Huiozyma naganishii (strain ATCC MYA-139 / BCRC 22969 / CBS 8797 / KCTC 17520 / NBRC 10181 / NCYC 3082 / Yp74L-3) TaxID=1071383 RepID=J7SAT6_HUIN7|nr:hypothetical protein KNAG_0M01710 [Kazachstania naganishii CBS 8797]CCK73024.1 hypothetical protein KNAG_0M01710 [Kazachstania naganishii CBS 8797]